MHVLLLPSWYKTPEEPVLGSFFEEQARALMAQGATVGILQPELLPFRSRFAGGPPPQPDHVDEGLPTLRARARGLLPGLESVNVWWLERVTAGAFARYVRRHGRPDVLHAHSTFFGGIAAAALAEAEDLPLVMTEHLSSIVNPDWPSRELEGRLLTETFARVDRPLVVSSALREALGRFDVDLSRVEVMPNMVSPEFFDDVRAAPESEEFTWFTVSFLIPRKRIDLLLRAFVQAADRRPELRLRVGGYGPERERLEALSKQLGVDERVQFLGQLSRAEVRDELSRSHAFALTSRYETFGVVAAEALAQGRPVVATDSGGVRDVLAPEDGLLLEDDSAEAVADAIVAVTERRSEHDAARLSARCRERFAPESVAKRLMAVYGELVSGASSVEA